MRLASTLLASIALAFLAATPSYANTSFLGNVTGVGTYGDGTVFIELSTTVNAPGCSSSNTIDVDSANSNVSQILALATSALASGLEVSGSIGSCNPNNGGPMLDNTENSWLIVIH